MSFRPGPGDRNHFWLCPLFHEDVSERVQWAACPPTAVRPVQFTGPLSASRCGIAMGCTREQRVTCGWRWRWGKCAVHKKAGTTVGYFSTSGGAQKIRYVRLYEKSLEGRSEACPDIRQDRMEIWMPLALVRPVECFPISLRTQAYRC
jgi:hypothetical protein